MPSPDATTHASRGSNSATELQAPHEPLRIGARELKKRLTDYLRHLRKSGEPIYVTNRGEIVAELRPVAHRRPQSDALLALAATGELSLGNGRRLRSFKPIKPKRAVSLARIVLEDRG